MIKTVSGGGNGGIGKKYAWQEFYEIEKQSTYVLSEKIVKLLQKLSEDVGIPLNAVSESNGSGNYVNTNIHKNMGENSSRNHSGGGGAGGGNGGIRNHSNRGGGGGNGGGKGIRSIVYKNTPEEEDVWDNIKRSNDYFKKSENIRGEGGKSAAEKAEGIDIIIQEIRICLNKMTDKNYVKQRDEIKEKMKSISVLDADTDVDGGGHGEKEKEWRKVGKILFDIASTNKFFSKIYAQLYLELMEEFALFREIVDTFIEGFILKLQTIQYVDPDKDYDGYCKYTKQQDERKAMTGFLVHLAVGYLAVKGDDNAAAKAAEMAVKLCQIVAELTEKVVGLIDKESSANEVEEITEILFLFFSVGGKTLMEEWKKGANWEEGVSDKFVFLSKQKVKEHPSLSSRALFKFSDIQKLIAKGG
jgi:hypothetical protein